MELEKVNQQFNDELDLFINGKLKTGHIFRLGAPGEILQRTGFPKEQEIELTAERLKLKSVDKNHTFAPVDLKNLVKAINEPVAVFKYGDKNKVQNVIIDLQKDGKNFLVGVHFNQDPLGIKIANIRTLFYKDNDKWLNWINQGDLLYANIDKLKSIVAQRQTNSADVIKQFRSYLDLEPINTLLEAQKNVKHYFQPIFPCPYPPAHN